MGKVENEVAATAVLDKPFYRVQQFIVIGEQHHAGTTDRIRRALSNDGHSERTCHKVR